MSSLVYNTSFFFYILWVIFPLIFVPCMSEIPNSLLLEMQDVKSSKEFFDKFVDGGYRNYTGENLSEFDESISNCQPVETVIAMPPSSDPTLFTIPKCVIVDRCKGCCGVAVLKCAPLKTIEKNYRVSRFNYNIEKGLMELIEDEILTIEEHTECGCKCKINPSDCTDEQTHDPRMCKCICKNSNQIADCLASDKLWDVETCQCKCKEVEECSTGYTFNSEICKCE
ncbi:vascular endothelial growth factor A-like isoform X1 [Centruroides vittatus]|uniref:vascular endothelial growth factor A-like isoform X1 n=2 Tax=Centruroides vittatus TaxID=120091 RepID=UPI0035104CD5